METPTSINPLGAKGIGESGTIGSTPAIQSAVVDAVEPPRRPPHRHADHRRARVAGDPGRRRCVTSSVRIGRRAGHTACGHGRGVHGPCRDRRTHALVDLDGTLTDSFPAITGSLKLALADLGLPIPSDDALRTVVGPPFELGLPLVGVPGDRLWAVIDRYRDHYEDVGLFECELYDGVVDDARRPARRRRHAGLATAKPEVTAVRIVEHFGLTDRFAVLAGATFEPGRRDQGRGHRPRPGASSASIAGPHIVMVGDRDHDVARRHGPRHRHDRRAVGVRVGAGADAAGARARRHAGRRGHARRRAMGGRGHAGSSVGGRMATGRTDAATGADRAAGPAGGPRRPVHAPPARSARRRAARVGRRVPARRSRPRSWWPRSAAC